MCVYAAMDTMDTVFNSIIRFSSTMNGCLKPMNEICSLTCWCSVLYAFFTRLEVTDSIIIQYPAKESLLFQKYLMIHVTYQL